MRLTLLLATVLLPVAAFAQRGLSEPLRANEARPDPSHAALLIPAPASVPALAPAAATALIARPGTVVLDVRTPAEFAAGHLANARNIDFRAATFQEQIAKLNPEATVLLYCASGNRSGQAAALMQLKGFKKVSNGGGYKVLQAAGAK